MDWSGLRIYIQQLLMAVRWQVKFMPDSCAGSQRTLMTGLHRRLRHPLARVQAKGGEDCAVRHVDSASIKGPSSGDAVTYLTLHILRRSDSSD